MKKKLMIMLSIAMILVLFASCDLFESASDITTTVTLEAEDGFALTNSSIAFNSSTSVSILGTSSTSIDSSYIIYTPTQFDSLEDGSDPVITFKFNEDLRADIDEAVYSISTDGTNLDSTVGIPEENVFYVNGSSVTGTVTLSASDTVTFTFDAGTFAVSDYVKVVFGVTSRSGEVYKIATSFQPLADVTTDVTVTADFTDYYAYAIDYNKVYVLNNATEETHTTEADPNESIENVSVTAGSDFGSIINSVDKRYNNSTTSTESYIFGNLQDIGTIQYIKLIVTPAENATDYRLYYEDGDGAQTQLYISTDYTKTDITDTENFLYTVGISGYSIATGDSIVVVPYNSRGEFTNHQASYSLVDTVKPYSEATLDLDPTEASTATWAGVSYTAHTEGDAHLEGEVVSFGTFNTTSLSGALSPNEAVTYTLNSQSLSATINSGTSNGEVMSVTETKVIEEMGLSEDTELVSNSAGTVWAYIDGTVIYVYVGIKCNISSTGIDYSTENWTAKGILNISVADLSGNTIVYEGDDASGGDVSDGVIEITLQ